MKLNKKGFTLIELLAVIVVLGIVMVIGVTTVLPLLNDTKKEAFATEAKGAITIASDLVTIIDLEQKPHVAYRTNADKDYCFEVEDLIAKGLITKKGASADAYEGYVVAENNGSDKYAYSIHMTNGTYYIVNGNHNTMTVNDTNTGYVADCNATTYDVAKTGE